MTSRGLALIAARVAALYVAFHAVIYGGELGHDLLRARPAAVLARSAVPIASLLALAWVLWALGPRVADAMLRDRESAGDGDQPLHRPSVTVFSAVTFAAVGLFIAAQAAALLGATVQRAVGGVWSRDATGDVVAAVVRIAIGAAIFGYAPALARRVTERVVRG